MAVLSSVPVFPHWQFIVYSPPVPSFDNLTSLDNHYIMSTSPIFTIVTSLFFHPAIQTQKALTICVMFFILLLWPDIGLFLLYLFQCFHSLRGRWADVAISFGNESCVLLLVSFISDSIAGLSCWWQCNIAVTVSLCVFFLYASWFRCLSWPFLENIQLRSNCSGNYLWVSRYHAVLVMD